MLDNNCATGSKTRISVMWLPYSPISLLLVVAQRAKSLVRRAIPHAITARHYQDVNVGMMLPNGVDNLEARVGYTSSAGAVVIALENIKKSGIDFNWKCEAY